MVPTVNSMAEAKAAVAVTKLSADGQARHRCLASPRTSISIMPVTWPRRMPRRRSCRRSKPENLVAAIGEIATPIPGIDALYIGPGDLAQSLGITPGELPPDLPRQPASGLRRVARKNNVAAGIDVASLDFSSLSRSSVSASLPMGWISASSSKAAGPWRATSRLSSGG